MKSKLEKVFKICRVHGELFEDTVIKSGINKKTGEQHYRCKECMKMMHKDHYERNKEKVKAAQQIYKAKDPHKHREMKNASNRKTWQKNKEEYRKRRTKWDKENPEKKSARQKKYKDKAVRTLSDKYVKQVLVKDSGLKFSAIPDNIVKIKRELIKLKRIIKEKLNDKNQRHCAIKRYSPSSN